MNDEPPRGFLREMFDIDSFYAERSGGGFARWLKRLLLFALGTLAGWIIWRIVDPDSAGDRSFLERLITNVYLWACLIATAIYRLRDRRARRQQPETD